MPSAYFYVVWVFELSCTSHLNALNHMVETVHFACDKIDKKHIVVSRLKRTPSIVSKLKRFDKMKLRNMQDIAGCRVPII